MNSLKSVDTLTQSDFADAVRSHQFVVVFFFNRRCSHSLSFSKQYEAAALYFARKNYTSINLAMVDVSDEVNKYLVMTYNNSRYPNVKIFENGGNKVIDYLGPRDSKGLIDCLKRLATPIPTQLNSLQEINNLDKTIIVGIFPAFSGLEYDKFVQATETLKWKYDVYKHHGDCGPLVRVYNLFVDREQVAETQDFNASLVEFVKDASPEVVTLYNKHCSDFVYNFFDSRIQTDKVVLLIKNTDADVHAFETKYRLVAEKYRYLGFQFMMGCLEDSKEALNDLGFPMSKVPCTPIIVIRNHFEEIFAKFDLTLDDDIDGWLRDYKLGRVAKYE